MNSEETPSQYVVNGSVYTGQTHRLSLFESIVSVVSGYVLTVLIQYTLFPLFGIRIPLDQAMFISVFIIMIAFVKNYGVRRLFVFIEKKQYDRNF